MEKLRLSVVDAGKACTILTSVGTPMVTVLVIAHEGPIVKVFILKDHAGGFKVNEDMVFSPNVYVKDVGDVYTRKKVDDILELVISAFDNLYSASSDAKDIETCIADLKAYGIIGQVRVVINRLETRLQQLMTGSDSPIGQV